MCLRGFHRGYSFLDLGTRHKELPLVRQEQPVKKKSPAPSTAPQPQSPEPVARMVSAVALGSEKIKCMKYKGLN